MTLEKNLGGGPALIYCRVSTNLMAKGTSLESQRAACVAHAERLGYTVARVTEEVFSGAELFDRPKLARDRADIRAGRFKAVIVYAVDRLTRDTAHLAILSDECDRTGCRLIFVTDAATEDESSRSDEAYAAGVERRQIRERTNRGRRTKLLQGRPVFNGWDLYGYRPDSEAGVWLIYEPEAAVVRRIFSMCAAGRGMHSIASIFNREGIPSPKSDKRPGARWSSGGVSSLLNSRSYMGEEICLRTRRGPEGRDLPRPESEHVRLPAGVRPAIVSRELWEECQRMIRSRAARMTNRREYPALLRGHIFCAECEAGMIRQYFKRGKYEYLKYRCGSRWRPFATDCRGAGVPLQAAHEWAWGEVKSILSDSGAAARALDSSELVGPTRQLISDLDAVRREHERTGRGLQALASSLRPLAGDPSLRPFVEREEARAAREMRQLEKTIADLETRIGGAQRGAADLRPLLHENRDLDLLSFDERRLAIKTIGFKAFANGDDPTRWRYELSIPFPSRMR